MKETADNEVKPGVDLYAGMREREAWARAYWDEQGTFKASLKQREGAEPFVFYEGPPTANGLPHLGHFLTRIYKDLYGRYKTMRGYYVLRRAGWDTHGLPVELELEKELGLKNKKDIEEYGVATFNAQAKASVWKYTHAWEEMTRTIGYWLDMSQPYVTYDPKYIESVWHILQKINERELLYQGHKVLPFCTRCGTALSSHEVAQGYKEVTDTSVYIKFRLTPDQKIGDWIVPADTFVLAWTTTPWTLPGNVALAVGEKIEYVVTEHEGARYIVAAERQSLVGGTVLATVTGKELLGLRYEPLFEVTHLQSENSYQIYPADFVTTTEGTGIVHTAVMYGEDDYELGKKYDLPKHHTVNEQGLFTRDVAMLEGEYVKSKKTEQKILDYLTEQGDIFKTEAHTHTYPHCWRCKTPLIYYAKNSWFIRMSSLRQQLTERNQTINWLPKHIRDGRFGEFLKEAKDWALSRERYWGTPLPIWKCDSCGHKRVVGAYEELEHHRYRAKNTYYLLRHGISSKNGTTKQEDIVASRLEHDTYHLTPEGIQQVNDTAQALKAQGGVDMIVSSPFKRTRQTAEIVGMALDVEVQIDEHLKELDHGSALEGKPHIDCQLCNDNMTLDTRLYDGESRREAKTRMFQVLHELDRAYEGKRILIVSHGDPIWLLESAVLNLSDAQTFTQKDGIYPQKGALRLIDVKNYPYNQHGELDPHKPYIDEIILKCDQCQHEMHRVSELIDVWFDSGSMPYAQWHYPFEHQHLVDSSGNDHPASASGFGAARQFPADFIVEGIDQTRGWFYTMLAIATALDRPAPYRNVIALGFVTNDKGKKLSKSEGAGEGFETMLSQKSIDALRWYFYTVSDVGEDKRFSLPDLDSKFRGFHMILLNVLRFYQLYMPAGKQAVVGESRSELDQWILNRLAIVEYEATVQLDGFHPTTAARLIEKFIIDDLSQWWLRLSRPRFQRPRDESEQAYVSALLGQMLERLSILLAPFMPFLAESINHELHAKAASIHLANWPAHAEAELDYTLDSQMAEVRELVTQGLAQRKAQSLKVRQPLAGATLKRAEALSADLEAIIIAELNIKKITYNAQQSEIIILDTTMTPELIQEGLMREIVRQIQDLRKEAGYAFDQHVKLAWHSEQADVVSVMQTYGPQIQADTLTTFDEAWSETATYDLKQDFDLKSGLSISLAVHS